MVPPLPVVFSVVWKEAPGLSTRDPKMDPRAGGHLLPSLLEVTKCCVCHSFLLVRMWENVLLKSFWWCLRQFPPGLLPHLLPHVQRTFWLCLDLSPTTELLVTLLVLPDIDTHGHRLQNTVKPFLAYRTSRLMPRRPSSSYSALCSPSPPSRAVPHKPTSLTLSLPNPVDITQSLSLVTLKVSPQLP